MTRYGFLIDQDTCIGCHACTVACKAEHDVPLGVDRTWVKYIERGAFPDTKRSFAVLRCNHCDAAPCITICPTGALFRRSNGIVDFDTRACIGCKSCMNACPYDALYIDPEEHTAQKCNFCAHRVEVGLEPSCVIVCPTQSIVAGDLDDPSSRIAALVAAHDVAVRAPEQGTRPKLFYKGADPAALDPLAARIAADGLIWADVSPHHPTLPTNGQQDARTVYTTAHPMPWGAMVSAYLVTKSVAAGALMIGALLVLLGDADHQAAVGVLAPVLAGVFTLITSVLLVADLKQPRRALYILTRPNWASWLTRGLVVLVAYAAVSAAWFVAGAAGSTGIVSSLAAPGLLLGAAAAGYTAFLFAQCEGRDLWQTRLLLPILLVQAVIGGAAAFLVADAFMTVPDAAAVRWALACALAALAVLNSIELTAHTSAHVEAAVRAMTRGNIAPRFWGGVVGGVVVPAALLGAGWGVAAGVTALVGLALAEDAFVRAGQSVPLS